MNQEYAIKIAQEFARRLKSMIPDFKMLLYGSYARNQATLDSDIDLYIEVPEEYLTGEIKNFVSDLSWELGFHNEAVIQVNLYSNKEVWDTPRRSSPLIQSIMKEGVVI